MQSFVFYVFLVSLLPAGMGVIRYKSLSNHLLSVLVLVSTTFLLEVVGTVLWLKEASNLWIGHIHAVLEFLLLANAYRVVLANRFSARLFFLIMIGFMVLAAVNTLFLQDFQFNNSYIKILEAGLLIFFSLVFFHKLAEEMRIYRLEKLPFFWVNTAVLIYFSSNLFVFLYSNYILLYSKELGIAIWFIHALFFTLYNLLLTLALWTAQKSSSLPG